MSLTRSARNIGALTATGICIAVAGIGGAGALAPAAHAQSADCQAYANDLASLQQDLRGASSNEKASIIREITALYREAAAAGCHL
jgi:hypothetical protein